MGPVTGVAQDNATKFLPSSVDQTGRWNLSICKVSTEQPRNDNTMNGRGWLQLKDEKALYESTW
jgi:hypothetical protein